MAVNPQIGSNTQVVTAGTAVVAIPPNPAGGFIENPIDAPGPLYVDPTIPASTTGNGSCFAIQPGQRWDVIPGQTTNTSVNSLNDGHQFSAVYWT